MPKIENAHKVHLPGIFRLLEENSLPVQGVEKHLENFLILKEGNEILGCGGLEVYGNSALLRSVAVETGHQGHGLGKQITHEILASARTKNVKTIYLLTETAEDFFSRFGFKKISRKEVEPAIQRTTEFTELCPLSAAVMKKTLA
jgi:amino-acid N-acetyltransferase